MNVDLEANLNVRGEGGRCIALNAHIHYVHQGRGSRTGSI